MIKNIEVGINRYFSFLSGLLNDELIQNTYLDKMFNLKEKIYFCCRNTLQSIVICLKLQCERGSLGHLYKMQISNYLV